MIGTSLRAFAVRVFAAMVGGRAFLLALVFVFTAGTQAIAQTMTAPDITSEGSFLVDEGETAVATLTADDSDTTAGDLIWSKTGGADSSKFSLTSAGVLTFSSFKDYETPDDADTDRTYEVTVQVSDGTDSDMAELLVTLRNVTELTAITEPPSVEFPENSWSRVATFTASSEEDRAGIEWILAGTDSDHFSIDSPPGALRFSLQAVAPRIFSEPPDFEAPVDPDAANTYELTLLAKAGSSVTDTRTFTVTVTDVDEEGALSLSSTRPALGAALSAVPTDPDGVTTGTALWQWERSTGRNSWAVIDGAAAESYTPVAADTNTFLRVTATYADEHGTGKAVSEVAPNVVTGLLLTGLTAETDDSRADTARGLYPAFDPQTLHYGIGCNSTDTLVLTVSAPANARVAVAGVQAASAPMAVDVSEDSDVAIRLSDASGAGTTYVVHCLPEVFFDIETHTFPNTDAFEDLILFNLAGFTLMDRNGVPRLRRGIAGAGPFAMRFHRVGADGAYRYGFQAGAEYTILDEDFEVVADDVRTVSPLTRVNHHDFQILEDGNYLLMSYEPATPDFRDIDLPYLDGADVSSVDVQDAAFQIVTPGGDEVFTWYSWGNMAIEDCVQHRFPVTLSTDPDMRSPDVDYAHINGMHVVEGVLVASIRGCSKVLGIDVKPGVTRGDVLWRMGRTNLSDAEWAARDIGPPPLDFINDPEGEFCGQHTARFLPNGNVFLFDNGVLCAIDPWTFEELGREGYDFSRAVEYALDLDNHEAVFVRDHSLRGERRHLGYSTGNVDVLDNGDWLVSWGRVLTGADRFPDNEMATLVDPATGQEKLGLRFRELPSNERQRRLNATVAPAEALAPQPEPLTALLPSNSHTSVFHTGAADSPQVVVAFNQPVMDFDETTPSLSVTGATVASVSLHVVAGEAANSYVVTLTPAGTSDITVRLVADQPCADGGICTAGETLLSEVPASHVIRADTTPPTVSKIEVSSDPGTDRTYAVDDEIQVTVTFSETVFVAGMPQLRLELGGGQRTATYEGGSGTAALVFGYTVAAGESDMDGVGVEADSLSGGTIRDGVGHNAVLDHQAVAANASHKVDGVKPALAATGGAVVDGTTLTLTYDEPLDGSSTPVPGDFTVTGGDRARTVTGVRVNGSAVELTLDVGAEHGEAGIQVSYTPGDHPIQDVPGNAAEALSREPVANDTPLTAITGPESVSYGENGALRVATYTASSPEDNGEVVWSLSGDDSGNFSIDDGVLRFHIDPISPNVFLQLPDFEDPADADTDNIYSVTVTASDNAATPTTVTKDVTVTVTNQDEPGTLTLSPTRPRVGTALNATLTDPDGSTSGVAWTWERSTGPTTWAAIDGAASSSYTPTAADAGHYLRATATYTDGHGAGKTARAVAPYTPLTHLLSALSVTGPARGLYPAFDPEVLHYAMECAADQTITLTLSAAESSTRVAVNGFQRSSQNAVVELTGLDGYSDIPITLSGSEGGATTYVLHCFQEDFPDIATEKGSGATEELIGFSFRTNRPGGDTDAYMMIVDNNGVPRVHRRFGDRVTHFRPQNSETYPFSYPVPDAQSANAWILADRDLNDLERVTTVSPLRTTDAHDFIILDNGDYLLLSYEPVLRDFSSLTDGDGNPLPVNPDRPDGQYPVKDTAIQIRTPAGAQELTWYSWHHMAVQDCGRGEPFPEGDWAHGNSLWMADGVIVASFRRCGKVLGIDAATGDVVWRLGRSYRPPEEWGRDDLSGQGRGTGPAPMTILNDPYGEFCGQHSAQILDNGHLLLYDNGSPCVVDLATGLSRRESRVFSRAVEYAIDPDNGEAILQRHHSLHGDFNRLGVAAGLVEPMGNGDWLISWGWDRLDDDPNAALPPDESVTQVDPDDGTETFSINIQLDHRGEESIPVRAYPLSPVALAARVEPLEATIVSGAEFHAGTADLPIVVAFNRPVVDFDHTTPSLNVTGATVSSISPHVVADAAANAYVVTLTPAGASDITVRLVADQPCADGGICTADGTVLSEVPASHVIRADTTPPAVSNIEISSNPGSDRFYIPGDQIQATVTFSETVAVTGMPQLMLELGGGRRTATYEGGSGTAALVFGYTVAGGDSDTDGVGVEADSLSGGTIRDGTGHNAVLDHQAVAANASHKVDAVNPELAATGGAAVNGTTLTLTYDEPLDGGSRPAPGDFTVSGGDHARTVTGVRVSGSAVELTLDVGAEHLEAGILVSYTPGTNPIQDAVGNDARGWSSEAVTNETPDTTSPTVSRVEISSDPGSDRTYAAGDEIQVTVTFNETVVVTGTPQLTLKVGGQDRTANYQSGTGGALVFAYEVADGDEDTDGVSIEANRLTLNGGRIRDGANNNAVLDHDGLAANSGHKVDGAGPDLAETGGAVVNGTTLTLTFGERLDGSSTPQASAFTVTGGDTSRTVTDVALSGSAVLLTIDPAVEHRETGIRVSYTVPTGTGSIPLQDVLGNDADRLSNVPVTNETPDTTSPTVSKLEITSDPGTDRTYAAGDEIRVTVTFSEPVDVERTPRLMLKVGDRNRPAGYLEGTGTTELVFGYEVPDGDEDTDGVSVEAGRLTLNGGTIRDGSNNNAVLDHDGLAANSGHKVDGAGPDLAETGGAVVNGTTLTLTYDEALDGGSRPVSGDFTVSGGDRVRAVTGVRVNGSGVALTLDVGAEHGEAGILVSYTPGDHPIQDVPGNAAEALSREPVANDTPDTTSPEVSSLAITSNPGSRPDLCGGGRDRGDGAIQRDGGGDRDAADEAESREQDPNGQPPGRHGHGGAGVRLRGGRGGRRHRRGEYRGEPPVSERRDDRRRSRQSGGSGS